jgi:hypothetical protein
VGGKQALFDTAIALFDPGDEVITHAPYWPTIPEQVKLMGAIPVIVPTRSEDGFAVHADAMIAAMTPKTKAIILNSRVTRSRWRRGHRCRDRRRRAARASGGVDPCYERLITTGRARPEDFIERHRT